MIRPVDPLALFVLLVGCSAEPEPEPEPDYGAMIIEGCEMACAVAVPCSVYGTHPSVEACAESCDVPQLLTQCNSRQVTLNLCVGTLTCEEFQIFEASLSGSGPDPNGDVSCAAEYVARIDCDESQPWEPPE